MHSYVCCAVTVHVAKTSQGLEAHGSAEKTQYSFTMYMKEIKVGLVFHWFRYWNRKLHAWRQLWRLATMTSCNCTGVLLRTQTPSSALTTNVTTFGVPLITIILMLSHLSLVCPLQRKLRIVTLQRHNLIGRRNVLNIVNRTFNNVSLLERKKSFRCNPICSTNSLWSLLGNTKQLPVARMVSSSSWMNAVDIQKRFKWLHWHSKEHFWCLYF